MSLHLEKHLNIMIKKLIHNGFGLRGHDRVDIFDMVLLNKISLTNYHGFGVHVLRQLPNNNSIKTR